MTRLRIVGSGVRQRWRMPPEGDLQSKREEPRRQIAALAGRRTIAVPDMRKVA
jgi:hypothetical protein